MTWVYRWPLFIFLEINSAFERTEPTIITPAANGHFYGSRGSDLNIEISFPLAENYGRSAR